ncbi:MAG: hypothetical protein ACI9BV_003765 [Rhodothermales bacterium]|jgi:hypothetical protein
MRTAVIYGGVAWVAIQVVATVVPALDWPDWIIRPLVIAIIAGFPVAIALSWIFDFSPGRLQLQPTERETIEAAKALASDPISRPAPIPSTELLGRKEEVDEVLTLLRSGKRCVTITGTGGTGKTRLAI